jgi:general secretion pathway protein D
MMNTIFRKSLLLLCLLLAFATTTQAQQTGVPRRSPQPTIQADEAETEAESAIIPLEPKVDNPDEMIGLIVLSDDTALQVLDMLEKMTGKIILRRQDIAAVKINFNSRGPLTKGEAVLALESLLSLNSIMLTDMGGRFMKAVPATSVNSHVPDMITGSTLEMPPSQQIYAKLFKFEYLQAEATSGTTITPLLSQNSSVVVFAKSNAVLITDALINLQRIERLVDEMDQPQKIREDIKFIKLNYIQASEMQQRLENLIQGPLKNYLEGNTSVTADERTNQLILVTHPGNLNVIMDVIESVDVDAAPLTSSEVFPLRQAKAEDVVTIIKEIIAGQEEGREEDAKVDISKGNDASNNGPTEGALPAPTQQPTETVITTRTTTSIGGSSNSALQFSTFVGLSADERTNAIVAYGTKSDLNTLRELIDKIDRPLPQVLIETVISLVTLTDENSFGINSLSFSYDGSTHTFTDIGLGTVGGITLSNGILDLDNPSDFSLSAAISPTNQDGDTKILSAPRIAVSHNEEGSINVSKSYPIITSTTTFNDSDGNTNDSVEYKDIGILLKVTPLIGADGTVQMVIEQTIENVDSEIEINNNKQPIIGKREATSTVSVKDGQIVILGGLQQNSLISSNSYFPLLGYIPGIKKLFTGASETYEKTEIIIFIRPTVLQNPTKADSVAREYLKSTLEKDAIEEYLNTNSTSNTYVEGSNIEAMVEERNDETALPDDSIEPTSEESESKRNSFIRFDGR